MRRVTSTAPLTIWTLGHGQRTFDEYVEMLSDYDIEVIVDVRSKPLSRFHPHFNRDRLRAALEEVGFEYRFLGDKLGGMPGGDGFYDAEGHVLYTLLSGERAFVDGIEQVERVGAKQNVALTCLEEDPERCHRHLFLGKTLADRGAEVQHIRHAGYLETQGELDKRMGVTPAWFTHDAWRSPIPMRGGHGKA
jgi:uncharacterized protein (DUF488 family)